MGVSVLVGVGEGEEVGVRLGVCVGVDVGLGVAVRVAVGVKLGVRVSVGVAVVVGVSVGVGVYGKQVPSNWQEALGTNSHCVTDERQLPVSVLLQNGTPSIGQKQQPVWP